MTTKPTSDSGCSRRDCLRAAAVGVAGAALVSGTGSSAASAVDEDRHHPDEYDWGAYRGGQGFSGAAPVDGIPEYDREHFAIGGGERTTAPVVSDGIVYAGVDERLLATALETGSGTWVYEADDPFVGSPVLTDDVVVGVTTGGGVHAVDREDGVELWSLTVSGDPGIPAARGDAVYVGDDEGAIHAFDAREGDLRWTVELDARPAGYHRDVLDRPAVAVGDDHLFVNVTDSMAPPSRIEALSFEGGEEWTYEFDTNFLSPPVVTDEGVCVKSNRRLRLLSPTGGVEQWSRDLRREAYHPPAVGNGHVAVVDDATFDDPRCNVYDVETGDEEWTYTVEDGTVPGGVTIAGDHVYFTVITGARTATVVAAGLDDGLERFSMEIDSASPGIAHGPVPIPHGLFVPDGSETRLLVDETFDSRYKDEDGPDAEDPGGDDGTGDDGDGDGSTGDDGGEDDVPPPTDSGDENHEDVDPPDGPDDETSSQGDADGDGSDGDARGFFTNEPEDLPAFLRDPFALTVVGLALSVVTVLYQLTRGEE